MGVSRYETSRIFQAPYLQSMHVNFLSLLVTTFIPACIIFYSTFVFVNLEVKIGTLSSQDGNAKEDFDKIMNFCL